MQTHHNASRIAESTANDAQVSAAKGLKAAIRILDLWHSPMDSILAILRISRSTYFKAKKENALNSISLDEDQLTRISFILNIHSTLRTVFENPDNIYGFMSMPNENSFFKGETPLQLLKNGNMISLYETFKQIDSLRSGLW